jgi:hypothetical protein
MSRELRDLYGVPRVRLYAGRSWERNPSDGTPGQWWLDGFAEALPGRSPQVDPVRVSVELGRSFDRMKGLGVFLRGYSGQDDYNLGLLTNLRVLHIGVVLGGEARLSFRP